MAYIGQADLEAFLGKATVLALFDDDNDGSPDPAAIDLVCRLGSARIDGKLALVFKGPFPIAQLPVPANVQMCALMYAKAIAYQRSPEYVKTFGPKPMDEANAFADQLCSSKEYLPDYVAQPLAQNVGGLENDNGARIMIDAADGTSNQGDF